MYSISQSLRNSNFFEGRWLWMFNCIIQNNAFSIYKALILPILLYCINVCPYFYSPEESGSILIMLIRKAKALNSKVSFGKFVQYEFYFSAPRTNNQKGNQESHHDYIFSESIKVQCQKLSLDMPKASLHKSVVVAGSPGGRREEGQLALSKSSHVIWQTGILAARHPGSRHPGSQEQPRSQLVCCRQRASISSSVLACRRRDVCTHPRPHPRPGSRPSGCSPPHLHLQLAWPEVRRSPAIEVAVAVADGACNYYICMDMWPH